MPLFDKARQVGKALTKREIEVDAQAWKCPDDGLVVLVIPAGQPVPVETEQVRCPNGHLVTVPKYRGPRAETFREAV